MPFHLFWQERFSCLVTCHWCKFRPALLCHSYNERVTLLLNSNVSRQKVKQAPFLWWPQWCSLCEWGSRYWGLFDDDISPDSLLTGIPPVFVVNMYLSGPVLFRLLCGPPAQPLVTSRGEDGWDAENETISWCNPGWRRRTLRQREIRVCLLASLSERTCSFILLLVLILRTTQGFSLFAEYSYYFLKLWLTFWIKRKSSK